MRAGEEKLRSAENWLTGAAWEQQWNDFQKSAFRLETLPVYRVESEVEEFKLFMAGKEPTSECKCNNWISRLAAYAADGKTVGRVHVIMPPLTDYLRYEFEWGYAFTAPGGEDVRILDLSCTPNPGLPDQDFWLFDDETVVLMHYEADGTQIGRERLVGVAPAEYVQYKRLALQYSVPFAEYRESMKD